MYRTDKIKLPRNKVELLKDKYNVAITRNKAKADYIVTSNNKIESMLLGCAGWSVTNIAFKEIINNETYASFLKPYLAELNSIQADVITFTFSNVAFAGWSNQNKQIQNAPGTKLKKQISNDTSVYQVFNLYEESLFDIDLFE